VPLALGAGFGWAAAAFELDLTAPRATAMGGAGVALAGDAWAAHRNPALAAATLAQAGLAWSQQFGLPELGRESVTVTGRTRGQPWVIGAATFGSDLYRESRFSIAVARELPPTVAVGIEANGEWLQIRNYSQGRALAFGAGLLARPVERVAVGAAWKNLNDPRISGYRDRIAESLTIGAAVEIGDEDVIVADVTQVVRFRAEYRLGAEARVLRALWIRVGARAEPVRPSAGIEIAVRHWHFLYAADLHPDLGASYELGLSVHFR
jgi:hypothetical protein